MKGIDEVRVEYSSAARIRRVVLVGIDREVDLTDLMAVREVRRIVQIGQVPEVELVVRARLVEVAPPE